MQLFLLYLFLFMVGCFGGWISEVLFRRFLSAKKWVNPGFMKGPWLPIYGFGVLIMFTVCYLCISIFPETVRLFNPYGNLFGREYVSGPVLFDLIPIAIMWISMCLLEFLAGLIFIKGLKVKLWDYSNMRGNIKGIVCPLFSIIWLVVVLVFYYAIDPLLYVLSQNVYAYMFGENGQIAHFGFIFFQGLLYGFFIYDFVVSIDMFKAIRKFAKESGLQDRYESLKQVFKSSNEKRPEEKKEIIPAPIKEKIAEIIYIDPEKEKNKKSNYDKKGRPIKE